MTRGEQQQQENASNLCVNESQRDAANLARVASMSPELKLFKFPETLHLSPHG